MNKKVDMICIFGYTFVIYERIKKNTRGGAMLTKFEEQILMTVWKLDGEGYGVNIFQNLNEVNEKFTKKSWKVSIHYSSSIKN